MGLQLVHNERPLRESYYEPLLRAFKVRGLTTGRREQVVDSKTLGVLHIPAFDYLGEYPFESVDSLSGFCLLVGTACLELLKSELRQLPVVEISADTANTELETRLTKTIFLFLSDILKAFEFPQLRYNEALYCTEVCVTEIFLLRNDSQVIPGGFSNVLLPIFMAKAKESGLTSLKHRGSIPRQASDLGFQHPAFERSSPGMPDFANFRSYCKNVLDLARQEGGFPMEEMDLGIRDPENTDTSDQVAPVNFMGIVRDHMGRLLKAFKRKGAKDV